MTLLTWPEHVAGDVYNVCCVDRLFIGVIDCNHYGDEHPQDKLILILTVRVANQRVITAAFLCKKKFDTPGLHSEVW